MGEHAKEKTLGDSWSALLRTIRDLKLPWVKIAISLALNLTEATLLLKLPVTTASLMEGNITGAALAEAILYYVLTGVISVASVSAMAWSQSYSSRRTRESLWRKMLGMRMDFFDRNDPAEQMSAITNDAGAAQNLVSIIQNLLPAIYYVVGAMITITGYHWVMAVSCFALFPLKYLYAFIMGRVFQKSSARLYQRIGVLTGFLADRIAHLPLIKTYTNEVEEEQKGQEACQQLLKANMRIVHQDNVAIAITSIMDILQKFAVVVVAVMLLRNGEIDLATWLTFFLYSQNLFSYMDQVFDYWTRIKGLQGSFSRVVEIMQSEDEPQDGSSAIPADGDVRFDHVTFTYPGNDTPALQDVSFTIPKGSSAAIVGLCGSGKTTAISLLERLYQPDEGCVLMGDTNVQQFSLSAYRQRMAYVQQGAGLFSGKIRDLVTYGMERQVSDEEIFAAAEKTGFDEYLALCQDGLNTEVAAGGSMSGGQAQRLVLTREVLRGGDIILLDEPTSALDVRVSAKIQQTIDAIFADKTRILVTHDLDFARRYDKIIVLSQGRVVGDGTHQQLMESCQTYRDMIENTKEEAAQ